MTTLEARIRAIEGVDLYDPVKAVEICLVPNMVVYIKKIMFMSSSNTLELSVLSSTSNLIATKWSR
jgi:hypothetical protein